MGANSINKDLNVLLRVGLETWTRKAKSIDSESKVFDIFRF